jgi:hypothetical protein
MREQHAPPASEPFVEVDGSFGRVSREIRSKVAKAQGHGVNGITD